MSLITQYNKWIDILNNGDIKCVRKIIDASNFNSSNIKEYIYTFELMLNLLLSYNNLNRDTTREDYTNTLISLAWWATSENSNVYGFGNPKKEKESRSRIDIGPDIVNYTVYNQYVHWTNIFEYIKANISISRAYNIFIINREDPNKHFDTKVHDKNNFTKLAKDSQCNFIDRISAKINNTFLPFLNKSTVKFSNGNTESNGYSTVFNLNDKLNRIDHQCPYCYLCGKIIFANPKGKNFILIDSAVDHIIPVIPGFVLGILQCPLNFTNTHRKCNAHKSDKLFEPMPLEKEEIQEKKKRRGGMPPTQTVHIPRYLKVGSLKATHRRQRIPVNSRKLETVFEEDTQDIIVYLRNKLKHINESMKFKYILYNQLLSFYTIIDLYKDRFKGGAQYKTVNNREELINNLSNFLDEFNNPDIIVDKEYAAYLLKSLPIHVEEWDKDSRMQFILSRLFILYKYSRIFHETAISSRDPEVLSKYRNLTYNEFIIKRIAEAENYSTTINSWELK